MPDHIKDEKGKKNAVNMMTLHAAKGLEFKVVFLWSAWKKDCSTLKKYDG